MKWLYNPPNIFKIFFPNFIWESSSDNILISFDDGPTPETTELILSYLQKNSVKAIFFCVGKNIEKYPSLAKEIIDEGHEIGNHTMNHKKINMLSKEERDFEIENCSKVIGDKLSVGVNYFRPPHGRFNFGLAKELDNKKLRNVMWSLLTYDYKNDIETVKTASENYLQNNSIVVLHDNIKSKDIICDSIDIILETAKEKHFTIGTPAQCLR